MQRRGYHKAPAKRSQHFNTTHPNIVGRNMLLLPSDEAFSNHFSRSKITGFCHIRPVLHLASYRFDPVQCSWQNTSASSRRKTRRFITLNNYSWPAGPCLRNLTMTTMPCLFWLCQKFPLFWVGPSLLIRLLGFWSLLSLFAMTIAGYGMALSLASTKMEIALIMAFSQAKRNRNPRGR